MTDRPIEAAQTSDDELRAAAQAVVERWDTPTWKDVPATATYINRLRNALDSTAVPPLDMLLYCPNCGMQHVDAPDERTPNWKNKPHRSHLCHGCGCIWRPADVPTNGVAAIKTEGKADTWPAVHNEEVRSAPAAATVEVPDDLREALNDAATSLETISTLSGRKTYGDPPIESFMGTFAQVRAYAANRASVARASLSTPTAQKAEGGEVPVARWHELKTDPDVFDAVASGAKTHEIRYDDRDFQVGDGLLLRRTRDTGWAMKNTGAPLVYTGEECRRVVSHVLRGYGLEPGWVILSFRPTPAAAAPIDMLLFCPKCGVQHVDAPEPHPRAHSPGSSHPDYWTNPPHKSHLCHACGCVWRPADVPTNGVAKIATTGKADNWHAASAAAGVPPGWKLVEDFHVGDRVMFEGVEHVIYAFGDRPGTFDIQLPSRAGDRWTNVPPSALKYAPGSPMLAASGAPAGAPTEGEQQ